MALSGLILFSDKVFDIELAHNYGFKSTKTFIWVFTQSVSPILLCLAANFKPYKVSYTIPVYIYFIQLYWVFDPSKKLDDALLHVYAIGVVIGFVFMVWTINKYIHKADIERTKEVRLLESLLDLYFKTDEHEKR